jgi:hypothetical protein
MPQQGNLDGALIFGDGVRFEFSQWFENIQKESSNYCEFRNLVNALLREDVSRAQRSFCLRIIKMWKGPTIAAPHQVGHCLSCW